MLRLVHPAPSGQGTDPPTRRRGRRSPSLSLTSEEVRHLAAALKNLRRAYGSWACLAQVMGIREKSLQHAVTRGRRPSAALALLAARAGGMTVEAILGGKLSAMGRCETCGARIGGAR